jgi:hypothetical protein
MRGPEVPSSAHATIPSLGCILDLQSHELYYIPQFSTYIGITNIVLILYVFRVGNPITNSPWSTIKYGLDGGVLRSTTKHRSLRRLEVPKSTIKYRLELGVPRSTIKHRLLRKLDSLECSKIYNQASVTP